MSAFHYGMNLRDCDREILRLGGSIEPLRRTGEQQYRHSLMSVTPRANRRRKDAPRHVVKFGMQIERLLSDDMREHEPAA